MMRAERIVARGFRNLVDLDLLLPAAGAVFLGPNGHGKTNLLELLYYPDGLLAAEGSTLVRQRLAWIRESAERFGRECDGLGEVESMSMRYRGDESLAEGGPGGPPQTFLTSPREDELPQGFPLERFAVETGQVRRVGARGQRVA